MNAPLATVEITRVRSALNMLRAFSVSIDGNKVDALDAGATRRYALPPGAHEIVVAMDFYKSPPCALALRAGDTVRLECGEKAPLVGQGGFSLRGLVTRWGRRCPPTTTSICASSAPSRAARGRARSRPRTASQHSRVSRCAPNR